MNTDFRTIDIGSRRPAAQPRSSVGAAVRRLAPWAIVAIIAAVIAIAAGADQTERALGLALAMTWEIGWALILGFALSAAVQAVVTKAR